VTGDFGGSATFGEHEIQSAGCKDIYASELSPSGAFTRAWGAGGACVQGLIDEAGVAVAADSSGLYVTGWISALTVFPPSVAPAGDTDLFVWKIPSRRGS
jgi:hypothetical protein